MIVWHINVREKICKVLTEHVFRRAKNRAVSVSKGPVPNIQANSTLEADRAGVYS